MLASLPTSAPGGNVRVYVIWEEITFSDWTPPSDSSLARIPDSRVAQYFDRDDLIAKAWKSVLARDSVVVTGEATFVKDSPAWDSALLFAPGTKWDAEPPAPVFTGAAVVSTTGELAAALRAVAAK